MSVGTACVSDMFFLHERGEKTGVYTIFVTNGAHIAAICKCFFPLLSSTALQSFFFFFVFLIYNVLCKRELTTSVTTRRGLSFTVRELAMGFLATRHNHRLFPTRSNIRLPRDPLLQRPKLPQQTIQATELLGNAIRSPWQHAPRRPPPPPRRRVRLQLPHAKVPVRPLARVVVYLVLDFCKHPPRVDHVSDIHIHLPLQNRGYRPVSGRVAAHWKSPGRDHRGEVVGPSSLHPGKTPQRYSQARASALPHYRWGLHDAGWDSGVWSLRGTADELHHPFSRDSHQ